MFGWGKKPDLTALRKQMDAALKTVIVPQLRAAGFQGSYPHFRRVKPEGVDLLVFQFDRSGGGFAIEISYGAAEGYKSSHSGFIEARHLQAWDMPAGQRVRVSPDAIVEDFWFRFENGQIDNCIKQVERALPHAEAWWRKERG